MLACAFHPELTDDSRVHALFMAMATGGASDARRQRGGKEMRDPRAEGLAKILVGYSTEVKEGEIVSIDGESAAEPLVLAVYEEVLKAGANPILNVSLEGQSAAYFEHACDEQLDWVSPVAEWAVENADVRIAVGASTNTRELSGGRRRSARPAARRRPAPDGSGRWSAAPRATFRWCYTLFPTNAYASEAEMSLRRLRGLLLPRLPLRRARPARRLGAGRGGDQAARRVDRGPRGGPHRSRPAPT